MKTSLFGLCFLIYFSLSAQWTPIGNFNGASRYSAIDFVLNGEAYLVGGADMVNGNFVAYSQLWKYDKLNDNWSSGTPYQGGNVYSGIAFVIDSIAYVGLGADQFGNRSTSLWAYDFSTSVWSQKSSLPSTGRTNAFAFSAHGKGYIGAGDTYINGVRQYLNDVWQYDPSMDSWLQVATYPGGGRVGMKACSVDNKAYVGMGDDGNSFFTDYYEYDPISDTWSGKVSFPGSNRSFYSATSADGSVYVIGGEDLTQDFTNEMWKFDPVNELWQPSTNFTGTVGRAAANLFYLDSNLYYGLGILSTASSNGSRDFHKSQVPGINIIENNPLEQISIFPNPFTDEIYCDIPRGLGKIHLELIDSQGKTIKQWDFKTHGEKQLGLTLPAGSYILNIVAPNHQRTTQVIKSPS